MEDNQPTQLGQYKRFRFKEQKSIRKQAREDLYSSKRSCLEQRQSQCLNQPSYDVSQNVLSEPTIAVKREIIIDKQLSNQIDQIMNISLEDINFQQILQNIQDPDILSVHIGIISLRRLLINTESLDLIQEIIDSRLVPQLVKLCSQDYYPQLKLQAAWILANLANGTQQQCRALIYHQTHIKFINMVIKNQKSIVDQALWGIGNLAASGNQARDQMLKEGVIDVIIDIIQQNQDNFKLTTIVWVISNIIRCKPIPKPAFIIRGLEFMCKSLTNNVLMKSAQQSYFILSSIFQYHDSQTLNTFAQLDIIPQLIKFSILNCQNKLFQKPIYGACLLLARFSFCGKHIEQLMANNFLEMCQKVFLSIKETKIIKEVLFALANIAADSEIHVNKLLSQSNLIKIILAILQHGSPSLKIQAVYIIGSSAIHAAPNIVYKVFHRQKIISILAEYLKTTNQSEDLIAILTNLNKIFSTAHKQTTKPVERHQNLYITTFWNIPNISNRLQQLQYHPNQEVYTALDALRINLSFNHFEEQQDLQSLLL